MICLPLQLFATFPGNKNKIFSRNGSGWDPRDRWTMDDGRWTLSASCRKVTKVPFSSQTEKVCDVPSGIDRLLLSAAFSFRRQTKCGRTVRNLFTYSPFSVLHEKLVKWVPRKCSSTSFFYKSIHQMDLDQLCSLHSDPMHSSSRWMGTIEANDIAKSLPDTALTQNP
jgi:hypothetical protein